MPADMGQALPRSSVDTDPYIELSLAGLRR